MIYIFCATYIEAEPMIKYLGLKKDMSEKTFERFCKEDISLCISDIGKINMAACVSHFLTLEKDLDNSFVLNIGICGTNDNSKNIGDAFLINKIKDHASGKCYYPDLLINIDMEESSIICLDKPLFENLLNGKALIDMESSGFFRSANIYLPPDRIYLLKIVSDYLEKNTNRDKIKNFISYQIENINKLLSKIRIYIEDNKKAPILSEEEQILIKKLEEGLKLTFMQRKILIEEIYKAKIKGFNIDFLKCYLFSVPKNKTERNRIFDEIRKKLI